MSRWNLFIVLLAAPVLWTGCSMCCGPYDYEYPMMENTRYPRLDPEHGRVGSNLSDPNVAMGPVPKTNADIPMEDISPRDEFEEDGPDDPNFNTNETDENSDPFNSEVDTSASLDNEYPRLPRWK